MENVCSNYIFFSQASGVQVADEVFEEYKYIKAQKKYRCIVFHIADEKKICIDTVSYLCKSKSN